MQLSRNKISDFFPLHRPEVVYNFLTILNLVIRYKTCNLIKLADHAQNNCKFDSVYKKFIRFFNIKSISTFNAGISLILFKFCLKSGSTYLVIDRTNWKIGIKEVNILALGFWLRKKVFVPIYWIDLDKAGNSITSARIDIFNKLKLLFDTCNVDLPPLTLVADREFIGKEWFSWLYQEKFNFTIRLRSKNYLNIWEDELDTVCEDILLDITNYLKTNNYYSKPIIINGNTFYFSAHKTTDIDDPYLFLLSTNPIPKQASADYQMRWVIEVYFKNIKTNGFNIEDINFKNPEKIELFFGIVTIAYALSIHQGYKVEEERKIVYKSSKGKKWKAKSLFRSGLTEILKLITSFDKLMEYITIIVESFDYQYINSDMISKFERQKKSVQ